MGKHLSFCFVLSFNVVFCYLSWYPAPEISSGISVCPPPHKKTKSIREMSREAELPHWKSGGSSSWVVAGGDQWSGSPFPRHFLIPLWKLPCLNQHSFPLSVLASRTWLYHYTKLSPRLGCVLKVHLKVNDWTYLERFYKLSDVSESGMYNKFVNMWVNVLFYENEPMCFIINIILLLTYEVVKKRVRALSVCQCVRVYIHAPMCMHMIHVI